ncbi:hypothetical protein ACSIGC_04265 [Tenacibaculum sp. ZS6-P6]|uniref:hypothetical protein n=1 Tax=Tenacibaculum sp. ZS6-P6 TaxID=3447503 RepID=UPI003F9E5D73
MINKISTKTYVNTFSGENFYMIEIDGKSLEDIILENRPDIKKGIVPTFLNWLTNEDERKLVWERAIPKIGEKSRLPILMCSDDLDLWCTLIMVEVETDNKYVYWNKFGLEDSDAVKSEEIGKSVEWFIGIKNMRFDKNEYLNLLNEYRLRLSEDQEYLPKENEIVEVYKF